MTNPETQDAAERLLRDTFDARGAAIPNGPLSPRTRHGLLDRAKRRAGARRRLAVAGSAFATVAVLAGAVAFALTRGGGDEAVGVPGPSASFVDGSALGEPPHDWVWRSSLGLQIAVPGGWELNDYRCHMTAAPSFADGSPGDECLTPEPPTKQVAIIGAVPDRTYEGFATRAIELGGVSATRTEGVLPDGRHAGQIAIPSRDIYLDVRTRDEPELIAILGSARLVDVDHRGCLTQRPPVTDSYAPPAGIVGVDPARIVVCYYGWSQPRLGGSGELDDQQIATVVGELRGAAPGRNPDRPADQCLRQGDPEPDAVLRLVAASGETSLLWVSFSDCTGRGVDNGARQVHVSTAMVAALMAPLKTAYGYGGEL